MINCNMEIGQSYEECFNLYKMVELTNGMDGCIAEVGVCSGSSAIIIQKAKDHRKLYLFDTFVGLIDVGDNDVGLYNGFAPYNEQEVRNLFKDDNTVEIINGYFPDIISENLNFNDNKFSFVHLDVDTYLSTLKSLEFFYDKMIKNGIILSHDYRNCGTPGVEMAIDEFFKDKIEHVLPLWDTQCIIIKMG